MTSTKKQQTVEFKNQALLAVYLYGNFDGLAESIEISRSSLYRATIGHQVGKDTARKLLKYLQQCLKDWEKKKRELQGSIDELKLKV